MSNDEKDGLLADVRALPCAIEPAHDLWPGIERAINLAADAAVTTAVPAAATAKVSANRSLPLAAAAVLIFGLLGVLGVATTAGYLAAGFFRSESSNPGPADARFGIHYAMGPAFVQARRDLVSDLDRELTKLSPDSQRVVLQNRKKIDRAILEINRALENEPNNELLQKLLLSTYSEEIQMLGEMDGMTQTLYKRTRL